jgi:hypothetical protein
VIGSIKCQVSSIKQDENKQDKNGAGSIEQSPPTLPLAGEELTLALSLPGLPYPPLEFECFVRNPGIGVRAPLIFLPAIGV